MDVEGRSRRLRLAESSALPNILLFLLHLLVVVVLAIEHGVKGQTRNDSRWRRCFVLVGHIEADQVPFHV